MQVVLHSYTRCCLSWFCLCSTADWGLKLKLCTRNNSNKNNQAIIKVCLPPPPTISLLSEVLIVCLFSTALPVPAWRKWGWWRPQQWWWWQWGVAGIWHHSSSCILVQKCVIGDVIFHMTWCYFGLFGQLVSLPVSQSCVFAAVKLNVVLPFSLFSQKSKNQQGRVPNVPNVGSTSSLTSHRSAINWVSLSVIPTDLLSVSKFWLRTPVFGERELPRARKSTCLHVSTALKKPRRTMCPEMEREEASHDWLTVPAVIWGSISFSNGGLIMLLILAIQRGFILDQKLIQVWRLAEHSGKNFQMN